MGTQKPPKLVTVTDSAVCGCPQKNVTGSAEKDTLSFVQHEMGCITYKSLADEMCLRDVGAVPLRICSVCSLLPRDNKMALAALHQQIIAQQNSGDPNVHTLWHEFQPNPHATFAHVAMQGLDPRTVCAGSFGQGLHFTHTVSTSHLHCTEDMRCQLDSLGVDVSGFDASNVCVLLRCDVVLGNVYVWPASDGGRDRTCLRKEPEDGYHSVQGCVHGVDEFVVYNATQVCIQDFVVLSVCSPIDPQAKLARNTPALNTTRQRTTHNADEFDIPALNVDVMGVWYDDII